MNGFKRNSAKAAGNLVTMPIDKYYEVNYNIYASINYNQDMTQVRQKRLNTERRRYEKNFYYFNAVRRACGLRL